MFKRLIPWLLLPLAACDVVGPLPEPPPRPTGTAAPVEVAASAAPSDAPSSAPAAAPSAKPMGRWEGLQAGDKLLKEGKHEEALAHALELKRAHPDDPWVSHLRFRILKAMAQARAKADPKDLAGWREAAQVAEEAAALQRKADPQSAQLGWRLFEALHAYHSAGSHADVIRIGPELLAADSSPCGDNWVFCFRYVLVAHQSLGQIREARQVLMRTIEVMGAAKSGWLFEPTRRLLLGEPALTPAEQLEWIKRLEPVATHYQTEAPTLVRAYVWLRLLQADVLYKQGRFAEALETYRPLSETFRQTLSQGTFNLHDNLQLRLACANFRVRHPNAKGRRVLKATILTAPETDVESPSSPTDPTPTRLRATIQRRWVDQAQEDFFWFAESWLPLSDGGIGWTYQLVESTNKVVKVNVTFKGTRAITHATLLEPRLEDTVFPQNNDSDLFYMIWPGTPDLPGSVGTTNGGVTIKSYLKDGVRQYRAFIMSEPHAHSEQEIDDALYIHHELFHMIEWAYKDADFPKDEHPCYDRSRWPADYVGNTEWDYYEQTFAKRLMPLDQLDRVRWADNSNPTSR